MQKTQRFGVYKDLLEASSFFKLVCGAGNENADEIEKLAFIYTQAGCKGFDVSASPLIVEACKSGIEKAIEAKGYDSDKNWIKPFITVSVGMPGDHHVRKAFIDPHPCVNCNLCIPVCPTDAIPSSLVIDESICIGCGNCEAVCPPAAHAIRYRHNAKDLIDILPKCVAAGAESIELHAGVPDDDVTMREWQIVSDCIPEGMISMCLDRYHLTNLHLIERIRLAANIAGDRLIIQADGIPMSGGTNDFNTTLQAISIADIINKDLKNADKRFKRLPILISGGTNSLTGDLARQCNVPFSGITIGTHARATVKEFILEDVFTHISLLNSAVDQASKLVLDNLKK
jgi:ferredoxin